MTAEGAPRSDRSIVVLLVVASLVHLLLAWRLELGQDEAYVLAVTGPLQLSFFDHPPLSFWLSTAMQALFGPEVSALGLRLPFVAIASASIWALYTLTARFYGSLAGLWAGSLYCGAPFFLASAGGWVMPDGPLVLFLLLAALNLAAILEGRDAAHWGRWVLAGVLIGLAMLSKYQAVLTLVGAFALLFAPRYRAWLARPQPYVAAAIALAVFAPVIVWNAQNDWSSFAFQLGRGAGQGAMQAGRWLGMIGREAIYLLPWSFAGMILAAFVALRVRARGAGFFLALGLPALLVFNLQPLLGPTGQPHWSMAGWLFLFPLLGWLVAGAAQPWRWVMGGLTATSTIVLVVGALLFADAYRLFGRFDGIETFAAESMPWSGVRTALEGSGLLDRPGTFLAAMNWRDTAKFAESMRRPVVALGDDPRGFAYLSTPRDHIGDDAVIAVLPDELAWVTARIAPMFASVETIGTYPTLRDGVHAFDITVLIARTLHDPPRRRYGLP